MAGRDDLVIVDCASCALSVPAEVTNLRLARSLTVADLAWNPVADAVAYNVYRGGQRDASDLGCFLPGVTGTSSVDDGLVPAVGEGLFYVTAAVNCAGESTLGSGLTPSIPCP